MRITRAAKVAAFPLTVLILVALVACQGPAGIAGSDGSDGSDGADGADGVSGSTGPQGFSALKTVGPPGAIEPIPVNNVVVDGVETIGSMPAPIDVSTSFFSGGKPDIKYTVAPKGEKAVTDMFTYTATIEDGSMMLMIATVEGKTVPSTDGHDYTRQGNTSTFTITATDADKLTVTKDVEVLSNQAPGRGEAPNFATRVGTQNAVDDLRKNQDPVALETPKCATFNTCSVPPRVGDRNSGTVFDFIDHNQDGLMFSAVTSDPRVRASMAGNQIVITGVTPTWDAKATPPMDKPAMVTVTATDKGKLSATRELAVTVDGAPEVETPIASSFKLKKGNAIEIVSALAGFFKDAEDDGDGAGGGETTYSAKSSNPAVVTTPDDDDVEVVSVTPLNVGTSTITVTATDSRDQTVTQTTTVTVTLP